MKGTSINMNNGLLTSKEYGKIVKEINTNYSLYQYHKLCIHESVSNEDDNYYYYYFINNGYNEYVFIDKVQY